MSYAVFCLQHKLYQLGELRPDPFGQRVGVFLALPSGRSPHAAAFDYIGVTSGSCRCSTSETCLAAWASWNVMPLQCPHVGKRRPFMTVTSCGISAWIGSCVIV